MPIYNSYSDNYYDDGDYYIPTIPKSPPSPMLVLKGDESHIDIDGNPYDSNLENNIDKFCEKYLMINLHFLRKRKHFFYLK